MIGMVTSCTGKQTLLPALLQWNIKRTDGEPCDSFSVQFLCGKTTKELLEQATEFRATEKGRAMISVPAMRKIALKFSLIFSLMRLVNRG